MSKSSTTNGRSTTKMTPKNGGDQQVALKEPSVAMMLQKFIESGVTSENVDAMTKLTDLYERMQLKVAEQEFNKAFASMQAKIPSVEPTRAVPAKDGTVKYRYAPFEEIMDKVRPLLIKFGFSVSFNTRYDAVLMTAICTLAHAAGHSRSNEFTSRVGTGPPNASAPQADAGARTAAKRAALCDALNIVVDHDDDARQLGKPVGKAIGEDFQRRVKALGRDEVAFLKWCGVTPVEKDGPPTIEDYELIPDARFEEIDRFLAKLEVAQEPK